MIVSVPNLRAQHGPCAEFALICMYLGAQNILDDYLFGYRLSHRLLLFGSLAKV